MALTSFWDWLVAHEDSAFGRARRAAALGLGPKIPAAEINSRNTAPAWQQERLLGGKKKRRRRKKKVTKPQPTVHHDLDAWLQSVDNLKKDLDKLKTKLASEPDKKDVTKPEQPKDLPKKPLDKKKPDVTPDKDDDEHDESPEESPKVVMPEKKFKKRPPEKGEEPLE